MTDKLLEAFDGTRKAGSIASGALDEVAKIIKPGIKTEKIDKLCFEFINDNQGYSAPLFYRGFPRSCCTSPNHVICHGIPKDKILNEGDIVNVDVTVLKDGWHGDTSKMFLVGKCKPHNERLVKITQECLYKAIEIVKPGVYLGDIGHVIQKHAEKNYYSVVEEYCGHGIGKVYHEEPQILHYGEQGTGLQLKEGMCFTIEPMINLGSKFTKSLSDGWTVETKDGRNSAQWEHTLAVTSDGCEVLTKRIEETF